MTDKLFDELARTLATPMPRRRALRIVGATLVGASFGGFKAGVAGARTRRAARPGRAACYPGDIACAHPPVNGRGGCCPGGGPGQTATQCCNGPTTSSCEGLDKVCCGVNDPRLPNFAPISCPHASKCCSNPASGADCCPSDWACCNAAVNHCCPPGQACGKDGCELTQKPEKCPRGHATCGTQCCPKGSFCCERNRGLCCRRDQVCDHETHQCRPKCGHGREKCGKRCCPKGTSCCDPKKKLCCKKNSECCSPEPGKGFCCDPPSKCARQIQPGQSEISPDSPIVCCANERLVPFRGAFATYGCCLPGQVSMGGKFVLPPGGGGGLCCDQNRVCGAGAAITCCGPSQTCQDGVCVG